MEADLAKDTPAVDRRLSYNCLLIIILIVLDLIVGGITLFVLHITHHKNHQDTTLIPPQVTLSKRQPFVASFHGDSMYFRMSTSVVLSNPNRNFSITIEDFSLRLSYKDYIDLGSYYASSLEMRRYYPSLLEIGASQNYTVDHQFQNDDVVFPKTEQEAFKVDQKHDRINFALYYQFFYYRDPKKNEWVQMKCDLYMHFNGTVANETCMRDHSAQLA